MVRCFGGLCCVVCRYPIDVTDMPSDSMVTGRLNTKYDVMKQTIVNVDESVQTVFKTFKIREKLRLDPTDGIWKTEDGSNFYLWLQVCQTL